MNDIAPDALRDSRIAICNRCCFAFRDKADDPLYCSLHPVFLSRQTDAQITVLATISETSSHEVCHHWWRDRGFGWPDGPKRKPVEIPPMPPPDGTRAHPKARVQVKKTGPRPGDLLKRLIEACGFKQVAGCGCATMQMQMNKWGWVGCYTHRKEILAWLQQKAQKEGIQFEDATVYEALKAAISEIRKSSTKAAKIAQ